MIWQLIYLIDLAIVLACVVAIVYVALPLIEWMAD